MIVYDGLLTSYRISFGPGIRGSLNENFKEAKERQGIITSLPVSAEPMALAANKPKAKARQKARPKEKTADVLKAIVGPIDQFCQEHLNEEYAVLCRKLAEHIFDQSQRQTPNREQARGHKRRQLIRQGRGHVAGEIPVRDSTDSRMASPTSKG